MTAYKFEYLWLDGDKALPHIRSKTKVLNLDNYDGDVDAVPQWSFDGSSTGQAEGGSSDCLLEPKRVYPDPGRTNGYLVIAEVLSADGKPHVSNMRHLVNYPNGDEFWFGFEQEYCMMTNDGRPIGFPTGGYPAPQGPYYCAVGNEFVAGREVVEEHLDMCLEAGIGITGINAEVMLGQWEYQCFGEGALRACDDLIASRYLLYRISEEYGIYVNLDPKPIKGDWNGSGMHTNFSFTFLRDTGGKQYIEDLMGEFRTLHSQHLAEYGTDNELRLTGLHETASFDTFSHGPSDRGASIRIPIFTVQHDWKGYLEDRRPASNADPYRVAARIIETVNQANAKLLKA